MSVELLPLEFIGAGEVQGYHFEQIARNSRAYIYAVTRAAGAKPQYEVVKRVATPKCVDFQARIFSTTEFKEAYPKAGQFGKTAWAFVTKEEALVKFNQMSTIC